MYINTGIYSTPSPPPPAWLNTLLILLYTHIQYTYRAFDPTAHNRIARALPRSPAAPRPTPRIHPHPPQRQSPRLLYHPTPAPRRCRPQGLPDPRRRHCSPPLHSVQGPWAQGCLSFLSQRASPPPDSHHPSWLFQCRWGNRPA